MATTLVPSSAPLPNQNLPPWDDNQEDDPLSSHAIIDPDPIAAEKRLDCQPMKEGQQQSTNNKDEWVMGPGASSSNYQKETQDDTKDTFEKEVADGTATTSFRNIGLNTPDQEDEKKEDDHEERAFVTETPTNYYTCPEDGEEESTGDSSQDNDTNGEEEDEDDDEESTEIHFISDDDSAGSSTLAQRAFHAFAPYLQRNHNTHHHTSMTKQRKDRQPTPANQKKNHGLHEWAWRQGSYQSQPFPEQQDEEPQATSYNTHGRQPPQPSSHVASPKTTLSASLPTTQARTAEQDGAMRRPPTRSSLVLRNQSLDLTEQKTGSQDEEMEQKYDEEAARESSSSSYWFSLSKSSSFSSSAIPLLFPPASASLSSSGQEQPKGSAHAARKDSSLSTLTHSHGNKPHHPKQPRKFGLPVSSWSSASVSSSMSPSLVSRTTSSTTRAIASVVRSSTRVLPGESDRIAHTESFEVSLEGTTDTMVLYGASNMPPHDHPQDEQDEEDQDEHRLLQPPQYYYHSYPQPQFVSELSWEGGNQLQPPQGDRVPPNNTGGPDTNVRKPHRRGLAGRLPFSSSSSSSSLKRTSRTSQNEPNNHDNDKIAVHNHNNTTQTNSVLVGTFWTGSDTSCAASSSISSKDEDEERRNRDAEMTRRMQDKDYDSHASSSVLAFSCAGVKVTMKWAQLVIALTCMLLILVLIFLIVGFGNGWFGNETTTNVSTNENNNDFQETSKGPTIGTTSVSSLVAIEVTPSVPTLVVSPTFSPSAAPLLRSPTVVPVAMTGYPSFAPN